MEDVIVGEDPGLQIYKTNINYTNGISFVCEDINTITRTKYLKNN